MRLTHSFNDTRVMPKEKLATFYTYFFTFFHVTQLFCVFQYVSLQHITKCIVDFLLLSKKRKNCQKRYAQICNQFLYFYVQLLNETVINVCVRNERY